MTDGTDPPILLTQAEAQARLAAGSLSPWAERSFRELTDKVGAKDFPCTFGTVALQRQEILFSFIESADPAEQADLVSQGLSDFTTRVKALGIVKAAMLPYAVFLEPRARSESMAGYFRAGWELLGRVHRLDREPWPERVPIDPDSPTWSYCFGGVPLFVNFKTPLHRARRSRHIGSAFLLLFQARDGFDVVAGDTANGRRAREIIRTKLASYDQVPIWPGLGYFGRAENRDWNQYFVPETNDPIAARCPFGHHAAEPARQGAPKD